MPKQDKKKPIEVLILQKRGENNDYDVLILDSAGRNHIDKKMMLEIKGTNLVNSQKFFVSDSLTGQDAVNNLLAFQKKSI